VAGVVGLLRTRPLTPELRVSLELAADGLDYTRKSRRDAWNDDFFCVRRVQHEHEPAIPTAVDAQTGTAVIVDGEPVVPERDGGGVAGDEARVCLGLYMRQGLGGFARLDGSFSLVVYEPRMKQILLVSDRFASRPLYYHATSDRLVFGTQMKAVLLPDVPRNLNVSALRHFLVFQTILGEGTLLDGVKLLPPASVLRYGASTTEVARYWTLRYREDEGRSEADWAEELSEALRHAIRRHTSDTRHLGLLLSGGLDSRAIAACTPEPMTAITLADVENREVAAARRIAAVHSLPFVFLRRSEQHYEELIDLGVELGDGAYRFDNAHFAGLNGQVPEGITRLVSGYGFDLLLKGEALPKRPLSVAGWPVNKHELLEIPDGVTDRDLIDILLERGYQSIWRHCPATEIFRADQRGAFVDDIRESLAATLRQARDAAPDAVGRYERVLMPMMAARFTAFLNVLSIRHFYRDHTVAFDNTLLDLHLRIPARLRLDGHIYKRALRLLSPSLFRIPNANTGCRPGRSYLVEHLHTRVRHALGRAGLARPRRGWKTSFTDGPWPNMAEWIRCRPIVARRLAATINDERAIPPELFDVGRLNELLRAHLDRRRDLTWLLLLVLTFGIWFRRTGVRVA
jgi:asparagine synthase (glutamine-hydrolysing)